jgi:hypothetical protein
MAPRTPAKGKSDDMPLETKAEQQKLKPETQAFLGWCDAFRARPDGSTIIALECGKHFREPQPGTLTTAKRAVVSEILFNPSLYGLLRLFSFSQSRILSR